MTRRIWFLGLVAVGLLSVVRAQSPQVEWTHYANDAGGSRYSPLTDVDAAKLSRLQVAWQWKHWETPLKEYATTPGQFESTPLMIDGVLYVTTPYNSIAALDAETGRELWRGALPVSGKATPMSYRLASGEQYVVVTAGGGEVWGKGDYVVAFRLPR